MDDFDGDFSNLSRQICNNEDDIRGIMSYKKIDGIEELSDVFYKEKVIRKGELTVEILEEIQNRNRSNKDLAKLVSDFNLINE